MFAYIFWTELAKNGSTVPFTNKHVFCLQFHFKMNWKLKKNDIEILLAKNRSSCSTQTAFKHRITASISEYNPRAISSLVLVGK